MNEINNFKEFKEFIKNDKSVIIFYTKWCPICKMLIFTLEEYLEEHPELSIAKVCYSDAVDVVSEVNVKFAPTTLFYNSGNLVEKRQGMLEWEDLDEIFLSLIK